jgi:large subunit ribosomal protein L21
LVLAGLPGCEIWRRFLQINPVLHRKMVYCHLRYCCKSGQKHLQRQILQRGLLKFLKCVEYRTMEFAVIQTGGKQYRVAVGETVKIEKLSDTAQVGDKVTFDKVLLVDSGKDTTLGTPFIAGAAVSATITEIGRSKKVIVIHYKQKSKYFKKNGHRQPFFKVTIDSIK